VLSPAGELLPAEAADPVKFQSTAVRGVSYADAVAYVNWRTQSDHIVYRLPKEWEWESACRGADGRKYSWGNWPANGLAIILQDMATPARPSAGNGRTTKTNPPGAFTI